MKRVILGLSSLVCLATVLVSGGARADIPRPDNHCPSVGAACTNAGFASEDNGVCRETQDAQCGAGGGNSVLTCLLCEVPSAAGGAGGAEAGGTGGTGGDIIQTAGAPSRAGAPSAAGAANHAGAGNSAGASNGAAGDGSTTESGTKSDDGGCSVRALGSERSIAALMLGLGLAGLAVSRRRR